MAGEGNKRGVIRREHKSGGASNTPQANPGVGGCCYIEEQSPDLPKDQTDGIHAVKVKKKAKLTQTIKKNSRENVN